ncbi:MAG: HEAT repeat domain-containing protein [Pseudomonadota bacterium]
MPTPKLTKHATDAAATADGYGGYEYQIRATVWFALEHIVRRKSCESIEVEPASIEDIEANLEVAPESAEATVSATSLPSGADRRTLVVQIKSKGSPWLPSHFAKVLYGRVESEGTRGPARRQRPFDLLSQRPEAYYCLLTDAQVSTELHDFRVHEVGERSAATELPNPPKDLAVAEGLAARIAMVEQLHPMALEAWCREIVDEVGRVPPSRVLECLASLADRVRARLLGTVGPAWTRAEIEDVFRHYGGLPLPTADLSCFVPPGNFDRLTERLNTANVVLVHGPAGSGKTLCGEIIAHDYQVKMAQAWEVVQAYSVAEARKALRSPYRSLVLVDDPWGPHKPATDVAEWSARLNGLIRDARGDHRLLIVSRTGNLHEALGEDASAIVERYAVEVRANSYDDKSRRAILKNHLQSCRARAWHIDFAHRHEAQIFRFLSAPFSLAVFAGELAATASENEAEIDKLIARSGTTAIAATVAKSIDVGSVKSAIALWALLAVRTPLTAENLSGTRAMLRGANTSVGHDVAMGVDLEKLVSQMRSARWLVASPERAAHPFVIDGLEQVIAQNPAEAEDVLTSLISGWVTRGHLDTANTLTEHVPERPLPLPPPVTAALEKHLRQELLSATRWSFARLLERVARGSASDPVVVLARALLCVHGDGFFAEWVYPSWSPALLATVKDSDDARRVAELFVRECLPEASHQYSGLVELFVSLGWDLSDSFRVALAEDLERAVMALETLVEGALATVTPPYDDVIELILRQIVELEEWWASYREKEYRSAEAYETDFGVMQHTLDEPSERFCGPRLALKLVVASRRSKEGWLWLAARSESSELSRAWAASIKEGSSPPAREELEALRVACGTQDARAFCTAMDREGVAPHVDLLLSYTRDGTPDDLSSLLSSLCALGTPALVSQWLAEANRAYSLSFARRLSILAVAPRVHSKHGEKDAYIAAVAGIATPDELDVLRVCRAVDSEDDDPDTSTWSVSREKLHQAAQGEAPVATLAIAALHLIGADVREESDKRLLGGDDDTRFTILRAHARKPSPGSRELLLRALREDSDFRCRLAGIYGLAAHATPNERSAILALSGHPSGPVRKAVAETVGEHKWIAGIPVLVDLLGDRQNANPDSLTRFALPEYSVARAAAQALWTFEFLPPDVVTAMIAFVRGGGGQYDDVVVHCSVLERLAHEDRDNILPLLVDSLSSEWHIEGQKHPGYPVRYAAAYALMERLRRGRVEEGSILPLAAAATHSDDRLATHALIALGVAGAAADPAMASVRAHEETTPGRALLWAVARASAAGSLPPEAELGKATGHPALGLIARGLHQPDISDADWVAHLTANPNVEAWLSSIQGGAPLHSALRYVLRTFLFKNAETHLSTESYRDEELAEGVPMFTFHTRW